MRAPLLALLLASVSGCGTLHNLKDRPNGPSAFGTGRCYPFGGAVRSGLLAIVGPPVGLGEVTEGNIGKGLLLTGAGLGAIVDFPLSLAGDILTFPIAYARSREWPWATWWGEPSFHYPTTQPLASTPEDKYREFLEELGAEIDRTHPGVFEWRFGEPCQVPHFHFLLSTFGPSP